MNQAEKDAYDYAMKTPGTAYGEMARVDERQNRELANVWDNARRNKRAEEARRQQRAAQKAAQKAAKNSPKTAARAEPVDWSWAAAIIAFLLGTGAAGSEFGLEGWPQFFAGGAAALVFGRFYKEIIAIAVVGFIALVLAGN